VLAPAAIAELATIDLGPDSTSSLTDEAVQPARAAVSEARRRRRRRLIRIILAGLSVSTVAAVSWFVAEYGAAGPGTGSPVVSAPLDAARPPDRPPADRGGSPDVRPHELSLDPDGPGSAPPISPDARAVRSHPLSRPRPHGKPSRPPSHGTGLPGLLSVNTDPWARVFLDGRLLGTTPMFQSRVPGGAHQLKLQGANGRTVTRRIVVPLGMIRLQGR
jgi:hypothetical protein